MDKGKFSTIIRQKLKHFNGGFFEDHSALPLTRDQLELLIEAASADWTAVEPAIFGTLLERALDPVERHKLGAHFTPRAYVERLVLPTIIEPLREEWDSVYAAAIQLDEESRRADEDADSMKDGKPKQAKLKEAKSKRAEVQKLIRDFHGHLCEVRVLDPACGSGNFLYVSLELMKRLEGEVLNAMRAFGDYNLPGVGIDPHQFLGIEINPRAAGIAELVLWIGFLQWHYRTRDMIDPPEPILKAYHNIERRDAVLAWDSIEPVIDADGKPVTRWDGRTTKTHPVTGEQVPDETARVQELKYINPRKAEWPKADYIVGNPPFIGNFKMREALGDGYAQTLRTTYSNLASTIDFVMYWWEKAAEFTANQNTCRFGFIATNSLRQTFNRQIINSWLNCPEPLSLAFAIPDHPWVDSSDGAAVRISMTVGSRTSDQGSVLIVKSEDEESAVDFVIHYGKISSDLTIGANVTTTGPLKSNSKVSSRGMELRGAGFILSSDERASLNTSSSSVNLDVIFPYVNGRDITQSSRNVYVIDLFGFSDAEVKSMSPIVFQ
jgi:hypothetical protein